MNSLSRLEANRANAQKSTGPKSCQGKARSAQNARKHGLRTKVTSDPAYRAELIALRDRLLHESANASVSSPPDHLSLAITELSRIITIRQELFENAISTFEAGEGIDIAALLNELETFEHYERRAHYRLHRAWDAYAPAPGAPPSRKQHLPALQSVTRACQPFTSPTFPSSGF